MKCAGLGGNPSSLAAKKAKPNPKKPKTDIFAAKEVVPSTIFKTFYMRNDLPVVVDFEGASRKVQWKVEIEMLDYHHYLPIFFEGLREPEEPMKFLADRGSDELITVITLVTWRQGQRAVQRLATTHPHGQWIHWGN